MDLKVFLSILTKSFCRCPARFPLLVRKSSNTTLLCVVGSRMYVVHRSNS